MSKLDDDYRIASIKDDEDIIKMENVIKAKNNKDVILIAYEKKK